MPYSAELWYYSKGISVIPNYIYYRTIRENESHLSITQTKNEKSFLDRDIILEHVVKRTRIHEMDEDYQKIMLNLIERMFSVTIGMIEVLPQESEVSGFANGWFTGHEERYIKCKKEIEKRIEKLSKGV
jgi:hypothetical protein